MLVKILNNKPIGYIKADESVLNSDYFTNQSDLIEVPDIEITEDIKYYEIVDNTLKLVSNFNELKEAEAEAKAEAARLEAEAEKPTLEEPPIPNISLRQCRELLLLTGRFDDVENILDSLPTTTPEEISTKKILTNYWEYSTEFERDHKYMSLITDSLGMTEEEVDSFFIEASKL